MNGKIFITAEEAYNAGNSPTLVSVGKHICVNFFKDNYTYYTSFFFEWYTLVYDDKEQWALGMLADIDVKRRFVECYIRCASHCLHQRPFLTVPKQTCNNGYFMPGHIRTIKSMHGYITFFFDGMTIYKDD